MENKTKVYKIELLIVDHDNIGEDGVVALLENQRYPNRAIYPSVQSIETREVYWSDNHPLNNLNTADEAYRKLFAGR
jgi:hypothetical protein